MLNFFERLKKISDKIFKLFNKNKTRNDTVSEAQTVKKFSDKTYETLKTLKSQTPQKALCEPFRLKAFLASLYERLSSDLARKNREFHYKISKEIPSEILGDRKLLLNFLHTVIRQGSILLSPQKILLSIDTDHTSNGYIFTIFFEEIQAYNQNECENVLPDKCQIYTTRLSTSLKFNSYHEESFGVTFKLPLIQNDDINNFSYQSESIGSETALLITDASLQSKLLKDAFEALKLKVDMLSPKNFSEAYITENPSDLLVVDLEETPLDILNRIGRLKRTKGYDIIAITTTQTTEKTVDTHFVDILLTPPITQAELSDALLSLHTVTNGKSKHSDITQTSFKQSDQKSKINLEAFQEFGNRSLLIVEDNIINQKILTEILSGSNLRLVIASNGQEALEIIKKEPPFDMILMDINMPVMDGFDTTKHIRQNRKHRDTPIVVVSALGYRNEIRAMYDLGIEDHLSKPFSAQELYALFKKYFSDSTDTLSQDYIVEELGLRNFDDLYAYKDHLVEAANRNLNISKKIETLYLKGKTDQALKELDLFSQELQRLGLKPMLQVANQLYLVIENNDEALFGHVHESFTETWLQTRKAIKELSKKRR